METFVPLYISNHCDSYCKMCNFNHDNQSLQRIQATENEIVEQLKIIYDFEHISAVCILTGEVYGAERRIENLRLVSSAINHAIELGFERVFFNIGSLTIDEIRFLKATISDTSRIVLSLFQETYDSNAYFDFFGAHPEKNAKADFNNRLSTIDRWLSEGFSIIDIGILLGFKPLGSDLNDLISHALKYIQSGAEVYISTPRIKNGLIDDSQYVRILRSIYESVPSSKLIITTRESIDFINKVIQYVSVISPGSSDICPYNRGEYLSNSKATSQFVIEEKRLRPIDVINKINYQLPIKYFNG